MITLYTGFSHLLSLFSSPHSCSVQSLASYEPFSPSSVVGASKNALLLSNNSKRWVSAPMHFSACERQRTETPVEPVPVRRASAAVAGAIAALGAEGCCYRRDGQTGSCTLTTSGWFALGLAGPAILFLVGVAGFRIRNAVVTRRIEKEHLEKLKTLQEQRKAFQEELQRWSELESHAQLAAVRRWLQLPASDNEEVGRALEHIAWEQNTRHAAIAKTLMGVSPYSKEDLVLTSLPHYLPKLDDDSKATIALNCWMRQTEDSRLLLIAALKSMSIEGQDAWIDQHKNPLLMSFLRMKVPEAYERFRKSFLSRDIAEIDENIAVMMPEVLPEIFKEAHTGAHGSTQRFVAALVRRFCDEVAEMEKLYTEPCANPQEVFERDVLMEKHIVLLQHIVKNIPDHWTHTRGDDLKNALKAAASLLWRIANEPYPESIGFKMKKPPSFCLDAVQILKLLSNQMPPDAQKAFRKRQASLVADLIEEQRNG